MRTGGHVNADVKGQHEAEYAWFSVGDSLPLLSHQRETAARQTLDACRHGDAEAVLSLPAKFATLLHSVFPELTAGLIQLAERLLPGPGGAEGYHAQEGRDSESAVTQSPLTALGRAAAERNNEVATDTQ